MDPFAALFAEARTALRDAPREVLGQWSTPRAILGVKRAPRIVDVGRAWRVGRLLLTDDAVLTVGEVIRSQDPGRRGYTAQSSRERAEVRAAALLGHIPAGTVVHVDWSVIDLDSVDATSDPLRVIDGTPLIRWSTAGGFTPLQSYLRERVDLLLHPLPGAN